jgi:NADH dehydrogenase
MTWTVLEPNLYMDLWVPAVVGGPALAGQTVTLIGEGRRRHSMIAVRDVAAYAVAALDRREAEGNTLVLGGPEPLSWRDVVAVFATELGRDVPIQTISPGEAIPEWPETMTQLMASMDTYDSPIDMSETAATYGVTPTSVVEFVHEFVSTSR